MLEFIVSVGCPRTVERNRVNNEVRGELRPLEILSLNSKEVEKQAKWRLMK